MVNFGGVKSVAPTSSLKMRNCQKKLERVYVYTRAYTQIRDRGGRSAPPTLNRVKMITKCNTKFNNQFGDSLN